MPSRDAVRRFGRRDRRARRRSTRDNWFPQDLWPKLGEWACRHDLPGGIRRQRMGYLAHLVAMEEISRIGLTVGPSWRAFQPVRQQPVRQRQRRSARNTCRKLCTGEWKGALAMSEPGAGSDVVG